MNIIKQQAFNTPGFFTPEVVCESVILDDIEMDDSEVMVSVEFYEWRKPCSESFDEPGDAGGYDYARVYAYIPCAEQGRNVRTEITDNQTWLDWVIKAAERELF